MKPHFITHALATLLVVFMSLQLAYGQEDYDYKIHFGIKLGMNISGLTKPIGVFDKNSKSYANSTFEGSTGISMLTGDIGFAADYRINDTFSASAELLLNGRGDTYNKDQKDVTLVDTAGNESNVTDVYNISLNYLELPLIMRYTLPVQSTKTWYSVYFG